MQKSKWEQQIEQALTNVDAINVTLEYQPKMMKLKAMFRIVQLKLYNDKTIFILQQLSKCFNKDKDQVMGQYMLGHFSIATLHEICSATNLAIYKSVYEELESDTKNQVDVLIRTKSLWQNFSGSQQKNS